ncbi:CAP domain-containing protein [Lentzea sp. HUAS12]|uniref:CAP domain-containing protein n=1 Tax=Lentzea sp. HUAS12 TaxID=2951806 RepID=UPI00209EFD21|nr:CAP domain-containing protein [Lentzea sp. HUAS12]USX51474.1 CAP domain-containing protein [Lentzea sp. HUAS12]
MSARSLLLGLLIGATGIGGLAFTGTSPLGIGFTTAAQQESADAANQFGTGNAAAPNGRPTLEATGAGTPPASSSSSSAPTTTTTETTPSSSSSSAAPTTTTTAPPEAAKPPTQTQAPTGQTPEQAVLALVNDARAAAGCKALVIDDRVTTAAQAHSTDMANKNYFSHTSQDGRTFDVRMKEAGYPRPGGENIAKGYANAQAVVKGWMNSTGHRENIENCSFTTMGVGLDTRGNYWTQNFGR